MALGEYGTALWIDNHTEDYYMHSHRGQRIAGAFAPLFRRKRKTRIDVHFMEEGEKDQDSFDNDDVDDNDEESEDAVGGEPPAAGTTMAPSVFCHHDEDSWVRLALDEREGLLLAGRDDGVIEIFEYI